MKRKLLWIGAIFLSAILYLFENNAGTLTLLVGVLVLPALGSITLAGKGVILNLEIPKGVEKGQSVSGNLYVRNRSLLPVPRLAVNLCCSNARSGENGEQTVIVGLLPKQKKDIPFTVFCPHSGEITLTVEKAVCADWFDLFRREFPVRVKKTLTVLPLMFDPSVSLKSQDMAMPDSDAYSATKAGSDPGETFAIREYVPGDAIRKIHWKLSEKTGQMMVREFGLPVVNEVALLLETAPGVTAEDNDAVTEVFSSISSALLAKEISHHIYWTDPQTDELTQFVISSHEDFGFMLEQLLRLPGNRDGSVAQRFLQTHPHCPYSHVIVVGTQAPCGIRDLYNGNRISLLLPRQNSTMEGLQPDGTYVLSFDTASYAQDLSRLEV